jgi:hypothetical protein
MELPVSLCSISGLWLPREGGAALGATGDFVDSLGSAGS